jgi:hypothetical protein
MAISWEMDVGINAVGAYQVSGRPFASGSINCSTATKVSFPYVTRWIYIQNNDGSNAVKVGFSEAGVEGPGAVNFFQVEKSTTGEVPGVSSVLELKVSEIWLSGSVAVNVVAGLTSILPQRTSMGAGLPSWSGSVGVG